MHTVMRVYVVLVKFKLLIRHGSLMVDRRGFGAETLLRYREKMVSQLIEMMSNQTLDISGLVNSGVLGRP